MGQHDCEYIEGDIKHVLRCMPVEVRGRLLIWNLRFISRSGRLIGVGLGKALKAGCWQRNLNDGQWRASEETLKSICFTIRV